MRKSIAVCLVVIFAAVFGVACAGGAEQQEIEALEARVGELEEAVAEMQLLLGLELEEEPQQEQTQPQQEKTQ